MAEKRRFSSNKERSPEEVMREQIAEAEKNVANAVKYLNHSFSVAIQKMGRGAGAVKARNADLSIKDADPLYYLTTEYAYMIDEVQRGPLCTVQKHISEINEMIAEVNEETITVKE
jgi:hypothetical protein